MTATIALLLLATLGATQAAKNDLISHWDFAPEHVVDSAIEDLAGASPAQLSSTSRVVTGGGGSALLLARPGDRALIHHSVARAELPEEAFTVEAWVSVDRAQTWGGIIGVIQDNGGFEKGWLLGYRGDRFCLALASEGADDGDGLMTYLSGTSPLGLSKWFHVAGSYDGEVMRLYVDGRLEAESTAQSGAILYPRRAVYVVGAYQDDDENYPMSGLIGEIKVWGRAVPEEELARRHDALRATLPPPRTREDPVELLRWSPETLDGGPGPPALRLFGGTASPPTRIELDPPDGAFTVEATLMVEVPRTAGAAAASGHPSTWVLGCGGGRFRFGVRPEGEDSLGWTSSSASYEPFRWYHVVGSFDGGLTRLFVDGEPVGYSREAGSSLGALPGDIVLGVFEERTARHAFTGRLHELRLFDGALTEDEVRERFAEKRAVFPEPLELELGPYCRFRGDGTAEISFGTAEVTRAGIELSRPGEAVKRFESEGKGREHTVTLTDLAPSSVHFWRVLAELADGRHFASRSFVLDTAFDYEPDPLTGSSAPAPPDDELGALYTEAAEEILSRCPVNRGWCLVLDAGDGRLAAELARRSELKIVAVEADPKRRAAAREALLEAGLYGVRVSVHEDPGGELPYGDWFANLIVSDGLLRGRRPLHSHEEVARLLRPEGGVAIFGAPRKARGRFQDGDDLERWCVPTEGIVTSRFDGGALHWVVETRAPLEGVGEWSHQYADPGSTASSGDSTLAGDLTVQWFGRPGPRPMLDRGARNPAPLYAGGRLYIQGDRRLFGLDAYNGTILWTLEIPDLRRANLPRDCSNMVADAESLFVAIRDRCWRIDGQSGERTRILSLPDPGGTGGELHWGYLARVDDLLLGSAVLSTAPYRGAEGEWYDGTGAGEVRAVLSEALFALDPASAEQRWSYRGSPIVNSTMAIAGGHVYFVEDRAPHDESRRTGRLTAQTGADQYLVALELTTGEKLWERVFDFTSLSRMMYLQATDEVLLASGASDGYHLFAFDAQGGEPLWEHRQPFYRDHHGGALQHPVLLADQVVIDLKTIQLSSGKILREDLPTRRGCGTLSASANAIFFRDYSHGMWNVHTGVRHDWLGMRSSCWIGMIPAGGLLLCPEGSSGCSCSDPIQTSAAFRPVSAGETR